MTINRLDRTQPASITAFVMVASEAFPAHSTHRAHKAHTSTQKALRALEAHTSTQMALRALKAHTSTQMALKALKAHTSTHTALGRLAQAVRENHFPFSTRGPILLGTLSAADWAAPAIMQNDVESEGHAARR